MSVYVAGIAVYPKILSLELNHLALVSLTISNILYIMIMDRDLSMKFMTIHDKNITSIMEAFLTGSSTERKLGDKWLSCRLVIPTRN